jgi:hypothetical protein
LDLRIADLLNKYSLRGTFYIPGKAERAVMSPAEIRTIARSFELGAHTVHHVVLPEASDAVARREIFDSKKWIEDIAGKSCRAFCFPGGKFRGRHLRLLKEAGFQSVRTVELLSRKSFREENGIRVLPTTLQVFPHTPAAYVRNLTKRFSFAGIGNLLRTYRSSWSRMAGALLDYISQHGGLFHLWGHSWEIEEQGLWSEVEDLFRMIRRHSENGVSCITNTEVCGA